MNQFKKSIWTIALLFIVNITFANVSKLTLADSLAKEILEKEGLYTVLGGLKPISTVLQFDFKIDTLTQEFLDEKMVESRLRDFNMAIKLLENKDIGFSILPFKAIHGDKRTFQVIVYNKQAVGYKIKEYASFFLKRGILPDMSFQQIITMVEFGDSLERFRAYGYFFGYPGHAVDFFVEASSHFKETKEFVERDFFQIPVASEHEGHFVYAVPKGYEPQEIDLGLRLKAAQLLEQYMELKSSKDFTGEQYPYLELYFEIGALKHAKTLEDLI